MLGKPEGRRGNYWDASGSSRPVFLGLNRSKSGAARVGRGDHPRSAAPKFVCPELPTDCRSSSRPAPDRDCQSRRAVVHTGCSAPSLTALRRYCSAVSPPRIAIGCSSVLGHLAATLTRDANEPRRRLQSLAPGAARRKHGDQVLARKIRLPRGWNRDFSSAATEPRVLRPRLRISAASTITGNEISFTRKACKGTPQGPYT